MSRAMRAAVRALGRSGVKARLAEPGDWWRRRRDRLTDPPPAPAPDDLGAPDILTRARMSGREVLRLVAPARRTTDAGPGVQLIYLHGGAYVDPLAAAHWDILRALRDLTGADITVPLYGLAPQHTLDEALPLLVEVVRAARARAPGQRLVLAGDSAGGGLALALALQLRALGDPPRAIVVVFSPWLDVRLASRATRRAERRDPYLARAGLRLAGAAWAGARPSADPLVSPALADPALLPPVRIVQGGREVFAPDVVAFARRARRAGADVAVRRYRAAVHVFVGDPALPEARDAFVWAAQQIAAAVR